LHACFLVLQVQFLYIDIDDDDNLRVLEFFGMKTTDCPTLRFITMDDDMLKYRPTSNDVTIQQFVQDVLDGKVKVRYHDFCSSVAIQVFHRD
jgi:protein disulfide-isomerase A1